MIVSGRLSSKGVSSNGGLTFLIHHGGKFFMLQGYLERLEQVSPEFRRNRAELIYRKDGCGRTPLMLAAKRGHYQIVELLVRLGGSASLDDMDAAHGTALHAAVAHRRYRVARFLIDNGSSPFIENVQGITAMDIACKQQHVDLLRYMESKALFSARVCQKVSRFGIASDWVDRWVVIAQRLRYHGGGCVNQQPVVRVVLLCYENLASSNAMCKVWLDHAEALYSRDVQSHRPRQASSPFDVQIRLCFGHPNVHGAYTTKRDGRYVLYFRPSSLGDSTIVSEMVSYINWSSSLGLTESSRGSSTAMAEHWATQPPPLLQHQASAPELREMPSTENDAALARALQEQEDIESAQRDPPPSSERRQDPPLSSERRQDPTPVQMQDVSDDGVATINSNATSAGGGQSECLICMDKKIEVIFCHANQTYECFVYCVSKAMCSTDMFVLFYFRACAIACKDCNEKYESTSCPACRREITNRVHVFGL